MTPGNLAFLQITFLTGLLGKSTLWPCARGTLPQRKEQLAMATKISSSKKGTEGLCTHRVTQGPSAFFC